MGNCHELLNLSSKRKEVDWTAYRYASVMGLVPWAVQYFEIGRLLVRYNEPMSFIPLWIWLLLIEYFFLFWCFPINMTLQYLQVGKYDNRKYKYPNGGYLHGEKVYIWLSLISKSLILWQCGSSAFRDYRDGTVADAY